MVIDDSQLFPMKYRGLGVEELFEAMRMAEDNDENRGGGPEKGKKATTKAERVRVRRAKAQRVRRAAMVKMRGKGALYSVGCVTGQRKSRFQLTLMM